MFAFEIEIVENVRWKFKFEKFYFQLWQTEVEWGIWSGFEMSVQSYFKLFHAP